MLSLFPQLLTFQLLAPALLRVIVGIIGIIVGWQKYKNSQNILNKWSSILYFITSTFLIIGLYTQAFALIGIALTLLDCYTNKKLGQTSSEKKILHMVIVVILLSLLFTGPGFLAQDLPL